MSYRILQVNKTLKKEIALLLEENLSENFGIVTVNFVQTAIDLKTADVLVSVLDEEKSREAIKFLNKHSFGIQKQIAPRIKLKFIPRLYFKIDKSSENVNRVEQIIEQIHKKK